MVQFGHKALVLVKLLVVVLRVTGLVLRWVLCTSTQVAQFVLKTVRSRDYFGESLFLERVLETRFVLLVADRAASEVGGFFHGGLAAR